MDAMTGVGLLAVTALLYTWTYGQFRRPQPKPWTQSNSAAVAMAVTIVSPFAYAVAFLVSFFFNFRAETLWLEIVAVVCIASVVCWFFIPRLIAPALRVADPPDLPVSASTDTLPGPANDPRPTTPARPGMSTGKRAMHRAA